MRSFTRFSKGLFTAGVLASSLLGMGACGPDYALFKVDVSSSVSPRNDIDECRMTVTDEKGVAVMSDFLLKSVAGPLDSSGNPTLIQGCASQITNPRIGIFSYSSSRTTGTLTFRVDAYSNINGGHKVVQAGCSDAIAPKAYPPEVGVTVTLALPSDSCP
jgi:hypothetical protein